MGLGYRIGLLVGVLHRDGDPDLAAELVGQGRGDQRAQPVLEVVLGELVRRGDEIVLREKDGDMVRAFDLLADLPEDLEIAGRQNDPPQKRKGL